MTRAGPWKHLFVIVIRSSDVLDLFIYRCASFFFFGFICNLFIDVLHSDWPTERSTFVVDELI